MSVCYVHIANYQQLMCANSDVKADGWLYAIQIVDVFNGCEREEWKNF